MGKKTAAEKRAKFISIIGHPLLTISLFVVYLTHRELPPAQAKWVSSIIIIGVALPVIVRNLIQLKRGKYANFDVSDQKERRNFYPFALMLLVVISIVFYFLHQPKSLIQSTLVFTMMVLAFLLCNFVLKASMHAGINLYITIILMHYSVVLGWCMLVFTVLIAYSRIRLKRHTFWEIIIGAAIGLVFGYCNTYFLQ